VPFFRRNVVGRGYVLGAGLLILLVLVLIAALPAWRYSSRWGYLPSSGVGVVLVVVVVLLLSGRF
jgi:hypothetical protein